MFVDECARCGDDGNQKVMSRVRRDNSSVDAMQHNNKRHRDASCDRQDGAGLFTVVLDRGILKSRGVRSRLTSASRPYDGASAHESYASSFCLTLVPGRVP
eukprot:7311953-Prymnesium_polylepis.1